MNLFGKIESRIGRSYRKLIRKIVSRVTVRETEVHVEVRGDLVQCDLLGQKSDIGAVTEAIRLTLPLTIKRRGSEVRLVLENGQPSQTKVISSLTKAVAWSRHWAEQIVSGKLVTMGDLAKSAGVSKIHARRMLRCAALSPALTEQILEGRQPVDLTFDKLTRNLPLSWEKQNFAG